MEGSTASGATAERRGLFYGWWLVVVAMITIALSNGAAAHGLGVFFVALERHFGWSRTVLSGAFALARLEGTVMGPVEGYLTDRFGSRRMVLTGFSILGFGFLLFSFTNGIASFYIAFMVIAVGMGLGGFLPMIAAVNNWFVRRRSIAIASAGMGNYMGGVLVPVLALGIGLLGWRGIAFALGLMFLALAFPLTRFIRNRPEEYGQRPDGELTPPRGSGVVVPAYGEGDFTARQAMRTSAFWLITFSHGLSAMVVGALQVHSIPMLYDAGLSLELASTVVVVYTFVGMGSRIVGGYLGDRFSKTVIIFVFSTVQAFGVVAAVGIGSFATALPFAVMFGFGWGGRGALFTALRGDYFGRKAFATIFGLSAFFLSGVSVISPLFAGYLFDLQGSYRTPLLILAAINLFGGFLVLFSRKPALPGAIGVDRTKSM